MLHCKDKWYGIIIIIGFICMCDNSIPDKFRAKENLVQPVSGQWVAIYGYHNAGSLSGYDELYLKKSKTDMKNSIFVLRIRGQIVKASWQGTDTLEVWSEGYLREFKNIDGLPIILKLHHIEQLL
ncbi:MAG TPA: hypothetical protein VHP36_04665 [Chitinispirillaceae bacterium]|nr:hypothetical protein [Chitinispirillaceae bacterium]